MRGQGGLRDRHELREMPFPCSIRSTAMRLASGLHLARRECSEESFTRTLARKNPIPTSHLVASKLDAAGECERGVVARLLQPQVHLDPDGERPQGKEESTPQCNGRKAHAEYVEDRE